MKLKFVCLAAVLTACLVAACGSSGPHLPVTPANLAVCNAFDQVVNGANIAQLSGIVFESDAPISKQLRQDLGGYISLVSTGGTAAAGQAQAKAQQDCQSIG